MQNIKQTIRNILWISMFAVLSAPAWAIDINQASAQEISKRLNGVGMTKAQDIVSYRNTHGQFKTLQDLEKVSGIGPNTIARNKDQIQFGKQADRATMGEHNTAISKNHMNNNMNNNMGEGHTSKK